MAVEITEEDIREEMESDGGFCTICEEFTAIGGIKPDARQYRCPSCGNMTLYGAQEALLMGLIIIVED